jgi:tetratricopeptide (TPR) repeat protein
MTEKDNKTKIIDSAENLIKQGKYQEAIPVLKKLHKTFPEDEPVLFILAMACYDSGDTKQAEHFLNVLFKKELKRKVFTGFAFDELVRLYKQQKNFQKLVNICEKAVAVQPEDVGLLTELGNAYMQCGENDKASGIYKKLTDMENDNPVFYSLLGEALFQAGRYRDSEDAFTKAAEMKSEKPDGYYFKMAILFQQARRDKDAERMLNQCIAVNATNPLYHCALGDSLIFLGRIKEAKSAYEKAVECDAAGAGSYFNRLGNAFMKAGKFFEAFDAFNLAIRHEPLQYYFVGLASACRALGLIEQADIIMAKVNQDG